MSIAQKCRKCGGSISEQDIFCPFCGHQIEALQPESAQKKCASCGALNDADMAFCTACGKKMSDMAAASTPKKAQPATPPPVTASNTNIQCTVCGFVNTTGVDFCDSCGAKLTDDANDDSAQPSAQSPLQTDPPLRKSKSASMPDVAAADILKKETPPSQLPSTQGNTVSGKCSICGFVNAGDAVFCDSCGTKLGFDTAQDNTVQPIQESAPVVVPTASEEHKIEEPSEEERFSAQAETPQASEMDIPVSMGTGSADTATPINGAATIQDETNNVDLPGKTEPSEPMQPVGESIVTAPSTPQSLFDVKYEAAQQGVVQAQYDVALCFLHGADGAPLDDDKAFYWMKQAARNGQPDAACYLGLKIFAEGPYIGSYAEGLAFLTTAAEAGDIIAQRNLGRLYWGGESIPQNKEQAIRWYVAAAQQDDPDAIFALGLIYHDPASGCTDAQKAAYWLEKSATQGNVLAQRQIAVYYLLGTGVEESVEKFRYWLEQAALQGDETAISTLREYCADSPVLSRIDHTPDRADPQAGQRSIPEQSAQPVPTNNGYQRMSADENRPIQNEADGSQQHQIGAQQPVRFHWPEEEERTDRAVAARETPQGNSAFPVAKLLIVIAVIVLLVVIGVGIGKRDDSRPVYVTIPTKTSTSRNTARPTATPTPRPTTTATATPTATPCAHPYTKVTEGGVTDWNNDEWIQECYEVCKNCGKVVEIFYRSGKKATTTPTVTPVPRAKAIQPSDYTTQFSSGSSGNVEPVHAMSKMLDSQLDTSYQWLNWQSLREDNIADFTFYFSNNAISSIEIRNGKLTSSTAYTQYGRPKRIEIVVYCTQGTIRRSFTLEDRYNTNYVILDLGGTYTGVSQVQFFVRERYAGSSQANYCHITDIRFMGY